MNTLVKRINTISTDAAVKESSSKNCITNIDILEIYKLISELDWDNNMEMRKSILDKISDDTQLVDDKYKHFSFSREEIYDDRF